MNNTLKKYLKIINTLADNTKNYSYYHYTLVAPVWLGLWNIFSLMIAEYFGLSKRQRFLVISIISSLTIMSIAFYFKTYNFQKTCY